MTKTNVYFFLCSNFSVLPLEETCWMWALGRQGNCVIMSSDGGLK